MTFRVQSDVPLTTASRAEIRFLNLVGDRYLALEEGADADAEPLESGATLPISQTKPALDLTTLFNGFQPLFQALNPQQVNDLSMNLVQVLQGEGGTVQGLLQKTASLTNTLADRDELIGERHRQPRPDPDDRRQPAPAAQRPGRRAEELDGRPGPRPADHRRRR